MLSKRGGQFHELFTPDDSGSTLSFIKNAVASQNGRTKPIVIFNERRNQNIDNI
jgi:hypothetical protein